MNPDKKRHTHPIENDSDLKQALIELQGIADRGEHAEGEGAKYFDQLMDQVTLYQEMYCRSPQPSSAKMLRELLAAARAIRQADMESVAVGCGISLQSLQDLVDEKRPMTAEEKTKLCRYFNVLPVAFRD
jgi:hypothetical protein